MNRIGEDELLHHLAYLHFVRGSLAFAQGDVYEAGTQLKNALDKFTKADLLKDFTGAGLIYYMQYKLASSDNPHREALRSAALSALGPHPRNYCVLDTRAVVRELTSVVF